MKKNEIKPMTIFKKMRKQTNELMVKNNTDMVELPAETALALGIEYVTLKGGNNIQGINFDEEYVPIKDNDVKTVYDAVRKELNEIHLSELTEEQVEELLGEIVLGSLYTADYDNTLGVAANEVATYAEGYLEAESDPEEYGEYESFYDYIQSTELVD